MGQQNQNPTKGKYCTKPCGGEVKCPFRKDALRGWLGKKIEAILGADTFVCHKNHSKQCAGHMLLLGDDNIFVRLAKILNEPLDLKGRELVFDTKEECIHHHSKIE